MHGVLTVLWGRLHRGLYEVGRVGACTGGEGDGELPLERTRAFVH